MFVVAGCSYRICYLRIKMPVLMAESDSTQFRSSERDVDSLVEEVRERLCIKSREKLTAARRAMPYSPGSGVVWKKGSAFVYSAEKHDSSQAVRTPATKPFCNNCLKKCYRCKCSNSSTVSDLSDLQQLLAERRLIQEAVRRVLHHQYGDATNGMEPPTPSSVRSSSTDSIDSNTFSSNADH